MPVPTPRLTEPMRWEADSGVPSSMVGGYFLGPDKTGRTHFGGFGETLEATYLNRLWAESGGTFPVGFGPAVSGITAPAPVPDARQARQQIAAWHSAAVVAVTGRNSRLGKYLVSLLGPPSVSVGSVLGWRLPSSALRASR